MNQFEDPKNILILGLGAFGIANLKYLGENINKKKYKLFGIDKEKTINEIKRTKKHPIWFKNIDYEISNSTELYPIGSEKIIQNADIIIIAIPSNFIENFIEKNKVFFKDNVIFVNLSKALSQNSETFGEVFKKKLSNKKYDYIALSGGMIAEDFINNSKVGFTISGEKKEKVDLIYQIYNSEKVFIEKSDDVLGVELCGSLKNLASIYIGYLKGKGVGYSELIRELSLIGGEIKALGLLLGAKEKTFQIESQCFGNDFIMSATGNTRNALFGSIIGNGRTAKEALKEMQDLGKIVEGLKTAKSVLNIIENNKLKDKFIRLEKILDIIKEAI